MIDISHWLCRMSSTLTTNNITPEEVCYMNIALYSKLLICETMRASLTTSEMCNIIHVESEPYQWHHNSRQW